MSRSDKIEVEELFWRIRASNGKILLHSEQYSSHRKAYQSAWRYYERHHKHFHTFVDLTEREEKK